MKFSQGKLAMIVRTALACSLLVAVVHTPNTAAQAASPVTPSRDQLAQIERTVMSPRMEQEIRQSRLPAQAVITRSIDEATSLPNVASNLPPTLEPYAEDTSAVPTSDNPEKVDISMAALSERLNGIRDATVFQDDTKTLLTGSTESVELGRGDFLSVRSMDSQPVQIQANGTAQAASATLLYALDTDGVPRELALVHRSQGLSWDQMLDANSPAAGIH